MTNPSKAKGTRFEARVVDYLRTWWPNVERRALAGSADKGDVSGIPGVVVECKNAKRVELSAWIDEALAEKRNACAEVAFVVFPRRSHAIGRAFVLMELDQVVALLREGM